MVVGDGAWRADRDDRTWFLALALHGVAATPAGLKGCGLPRAEVPEGGEGYRGGCALVVRVVSRRGGFRLRGRGCRCR